MLKLSEIKKAFSSSNMPTDDIHSIFTDLDLHENGVINYTEFMVEVIDKRKALVHKNLMLAFHHFEDSQTGFITYESLIECFRREGKHLTFKQV